MNNDTCSPEIRDLIFLVMAGHDVKRVIDEMCVLLNAYLLDKHESFNSNEAQHFAACVRKIQFTSRDMLLSIDDTLAILDKDNTVLEPLSALLQLVCGSSSTALKLVSSRTAGGRYELEWHDAPPNQWMM